MSGTGGMMMSKPQQGLRNQEATIYIGNLDDQTTEPLLWEMMLQAGPVVHVHIPRDRVTQQHAGYGFCEFQSEGDAEYAVKVMNGIRLFGKPIRINKSSLDRKSMDVGANLFIGNLAPDADEKLLFDTFILFGTLIQTPKVSRDDATGASKGFAFVSYDSFEVADAAIEAMNGQYLCGRPVTVNYAFKKDGKGERHGGAAERLLAAQTRKSLAAAGVVTVAPSQFALQQQQMQQQQAQHVQMMQAQLQTMQGSAGMANAPVMYPSNVPAAMYYGGVQTPSSYPGMYSPQQQGMMTQQPGIMTQQPGIMTQQPGIMTQQPGIMMMTHPQQQPGIMMMAQQPGMMAHPQQQPQHGMMAYPQQQQHGMMAYPQQQQQHGMMAYPPYPQQIQQPQQAYYPSMPQTPPIMPQQDSPK